MILTRLYELYDRLADDTECADQLPAFGSSIQKVSFVVVLSEDGKLIDIQDCKVQVERPAKKKGAAPVYDFKPRDMILPGTAHPPGSAPTPRFLWDGPAYIFGYYPKSWIIVQRLKTVAGCNAQVATRVLPFREPFAGRREGV